jgi:uroporphyrinogen-III synthase
VRLLVTRPEPEAERTAAALARAGHEVLRAPMLRVEPVAPVDLGRGPWAAVALTSANAARVLAQHPRKIEVVSLPAFAVGRHTAEAARAVGFARVESADGNFEDLVRLLAQRRADIAGPLLYPAGEDRAGDLAAALAGWGLQVALVVVYRTVPVEKFPEEVNVALRTGAVEGVLHFSRRSAAAFLAAAEVAGLVENVTGMRHYCLSAQVAEPLSARGLTHLRIAARPQESALLDLLET